ncbi:MAG: hypothetical protein ACNA7Q_05700 [Rhodobacterales bacterium]
MTKAAQELGGSPSAVSQRVFLPKTSA